MKKQLLAFSLVMAGLGLVAQTPRLSLFEEFTGETCGPCASTNPGLNIKLANPTNTPLIVPIKWQVPIPSAPSATWSLYQTNKVEIDWRWQTYGYGINSAPSARIDGQSLTVFGATSDHPTYFSNAMVATASSYTSAFSITLNTAWDSNLSSINVTVNIAATASFAPVGALKFRLVMVERKIQFLTQPGTNGETLFEDAAIRSYPSIQGGTALTPGNWANLQTQTFTMNCVVPTYVRDKSEVAFVGFIQDDGDMKVAQAVRTQKTTFANDAKAISASVTDYFTCGNSADPEVVVKNSGTTAITAMTLTPMIDGIASTQTTWTGNLAVGATVNIPLTTVTSAIGGGHNCVVDISAVSGTDFNTSNNKASTSFYMASNYSGAAVVEGFVSPNFPPALFGVINANGGASWSRSGAAGGFVLTNNSAKYDFYSNSVKGDADDLLLPPMNLSGAITPSLVFDVAYCQYASENDQLEVLVSEDCGVNWDVVYTKSGAALKTRAPFTGVFTPTSAAQWRKETVELTNAVNLSTILVKFRATSDYGNNMYIDNINLKQMNPTGIAAVKNTNESIDIFPNPANGAATLMINAKSPSKADISIVNVLGQSVYTQQTNLNEGTNNVQLNVSEFAAGVYNVVIESKNGSVVKKLNVTK